MSECSSPWVGGDWVDVFSRSGFRGRRTRVLGPGRLDELPSQVASVVTGSRCEVRFVGPSGRSAHLPPGSRIDHLKAMLDGFPVAMEISIAVLELRSAA